MAEIFDPKPVEEKGFEIDERIIKLAEKAEENCSAVFAETDRIARLNGEKVLKAFINNKVSAACMTGTTGYGYGDVGRDILDKVYADVFGAEDALVRHTFVSGTHALTCALFGVLRAGDKLVSLTGTPYDTLEEVIGLRGSGNGSLKDFGVQYDQVDLLPDGKPDVGEIFKKVKSLSKAEILSASHNIKVSECKTAAKRVQREFLKTEKELQGLKREVIKAVTGDSAFPLNLLSSLVQETEHKCVALKQAYEEAQYSVDENEKFLQELENKYNQFIAWSNIYDTANMETRKMIVAQVIERVEVFRGYELKMKFTISVQQFLIGLDISA